jgi:PAS domain-containing protein
MNRLTFSTVAGFISCVSVFFLVVFFEYKYLAAVFAISLTLSFLLVIYLNIDNLETNYEYPRKSFFAFFVPSLDSKTKITVFSLFFLIVLLSMFYLFNISEKKAYIRSLINQDREYLHNVMTSDISCMDEIFEKVTSYLESSNYSFAGIEKLEGVGKVHNIYYITDEKEEKLVKDIELHFDPERLQPVLNENDKIFIIQVSDKKVLLSIISSEISGSGVYEYIDVVFDVTQLINNLSRVFGYDFVLVRSDDKISLSSESFSTGFTADSGKIYNSLKKRESEFLIFKNSDNSYAAARLDFKGFSPEIFSQGFIVKKIKNQYYGTKYFLIEMMLGTFLCILIIIFLYTYTERINKTVTDVIAERDEYESSGVEKDINIKAALNAIDQGVILTDISGFIDSINFSAEMLTGLSLNYSKDKNITDIFNFQSSLSSPYIANSEDVLDEIIKSKKIFFECGLKDNNRIGLKVILHASVITSDYNETIGFVFLIKNMLYDTMEEEDMSRVLYDALDVTDTGVWELNFKKRKIFFSDSFKNLLSLHEKGSFVFMDEYFKMIHPNERENVKVLFDSHLHGSSSFYKSEHRIKTGNGQYLWVCDKGRVIERTEHGDPLKMVCITYETSGLKYQESFIANLKSLFSSGPVAYFLWKNREGLPAAYVSSNIEKVAGYSEDDFISGKMLYQDIIDAKDYELLKHELENMEKSEKADIDIVIGVYNGVGIKHNYRHYIRSVFDEAGNVTHYMGYLLLN